MGVLREISERLSNPAPACDGWLVEVLIQDLHGRSAKQLLFAAAIDEEAAAVRAVRAHLGGLHCTVAARFRLAPRALAQLGAMPGAVRPFSQ